MNIPIKYWGTVHCSDEIYLILKLYGMRNLQYEIRICHKTPVYIKTMMESQWQFISTVDSGNSELGFVTNFVY